MPHMSLVGWLEEICCFDLAEDQEVIKKYTWYFQHVWKSGIDIYCNIYFWINPDCRNDVGKV